MTDSADSPRPDRPVEWRPPRERESNVASIVVGLGFLAIGGWYLLDHTLGFQMPRIDWSDFWPIVLITIGGVMVYRAARRRT